MHLWPSIRIRDSFKTAYLKKLELNLHRMKSGKTSQSQQQNSNQRKLLDDDSKNETSNPENGVSDETPMMSKAALVVKEILMLLTCCYCCFCCGGIRAYITVHRVYDGICHHNKKETLERFFYELVLTKRRFDTISARFGH